MPEGRNQAVGAPLREPRPEPARTPDSPHGVPRADAGVPPASGERDGDGSRDEGNAARRAGTAPVVRLVEEILRSAVRSRASDVHFEPFEGEFRVRSRVDGTLREHTVLPVAHSPPVISRLKVMAGLNIAERRVPQDGRIRFAVDGRAVDLRVSTLPTQAGESVVLRVLDQSAVPRSLPDLGLPAATEAGLRAVIRRPHGILLVTGPTGSGKTTTLYSCLRILNSVERKVLTAEDPVEYEIDGVMQLPVNAAIGLTFATALRAFLRQDPDVLMVGEIRDLETARVAVQAALTGHLVLSTLHTTDAAGAITRLVDMGVEPYLVCATLEAVLAQRLVRCVCPVCAAAARGCEACGGTGYRGRTGVFEWLRLTGSMRERVMENAAAVDLTEFAVARGMQTLRTAGRELVARGRTTPEELARNL